MAVNRINKSNLESIIGGKVSEPHDVIIKFYGQNCHLCHALRENFVEISNQYDDVYFYAFNMSDGEGLEKRLGFDGVPSICYIRTGGAKPTIRFMQEPDNPDGKTWYRPDDIRSFIENNKR